MREVREEKFEHVNEPRRRGVGGSVGVCSLARATTRIGRIIARSLEKLAIECSYTW